MPVETSILHLTIFSLPSPIGDMLLVCDQQGHLHAADFSDCAQRLYDNLHKRMRNRAYALQTGAAVETISTAMDDYFNGELARIDALVLVMHATLFQEKVWTGLRKILPGTTKAYGAFATELGSVNSARAIGHANGANPFNIIVPCHRLVAANGQLTGYGGGLSRKRWLLDHEARFSI